MSDRVIRYIVHLLGPGDSPLPRHGFTGQPILRIVAESYTDASKQARELTPALHRIDRIERIN